MKASIDFSLFMQASERRGAQLPWLVLWVLADGEGLVLSDASQGPREDSAAGGSCSASFAHLLMLAVSESLSTLVVSQKERPL